MPSLKYFFLRLYYWPFFYCGCNLKHGASMRWTIRSLFGKKKLLTSLSYESVSMLMFMTYSLLSFFYCIFFWIIGYALLVMNIPSFMRASKNFLIFKCRSIHVPICASIAPIWESWMPWKYFLKFVVLTFFWCSPPSNV
jgi:hypothetical protein